MKPVGLTNPHKPAEKAYAVVQLRRDNKLGTLYNIVGFQTKMKYGAQTDVFRMIPGLQDAVLRAARRHPPQHLHQLAHAAGRADAPALQAAYPLRRPDHRRRGLCRKRRHGPSGRPHGRRRDHGHDAAPVPRHHRHGRADAPHHRRGGGQDLPADEREFRPLPPLDGVRGGRRGRKERYKAYTDRAKADWQGWLGLDQGRTPPPPNDLDRWGARRASLGP
jgi:methylenetetrahydrofolate--tRNA-(uracil-5-)-methyltransferase